MIEFSHGSKISLFFEHKQTYLAVVAGESIEAVARKLLIERDGIEAGATIETSHPIGSVCWRGTITAERFNAGLRVNHKVRACCAAVQCQLRHKQLPRLRALNKDMFDWSLVIRYKTKKA